MIQQGQVFKLKATRAEGEPLWAYRYRVGGRGSARLQVGGFRSRAEAQRALQNRLSRLLSGRAATLNQRGRPPRGLGDYDPRAATHERTGMPTCDARRAAVEPRQLRFARVGVNGA